MKSSPSQAHRLTISLKYKFAIFTSGLILLVCTVLSIFLMNKVETELMRQIHLRGMSTLSNFAQNAKNSILTRDRYLLKTYVEAEISKESIVHVIVVNEKGIVLGHNNPSMVGRTIEDEYSWSLLETLNRKTMRRVTIPTGEVVYDFVMPILDKDIYTADRYADPALARSRIPEGKNLGLIRIGISFRKMEDSISDTYRLVTLISLIIAIGTILLSFWYGKVLIRPLTEMTRIAGRLASGYLDERVDIQSNDEIGVLADNFNTMAKSLQESRSNLWKLNKELEYIVEERTGELRKAYQELQQIDQLKSTFLSTVSHELRTPLTSILGFAKIIQKQFRRNIVPNLDQENKKTVKSQTTIQNNLEIITTESIRLARLINDVLDLAKIESGKMDWKVEDVDLAELFKRALDNLASLIENKPVILELRVDPRGVPLLKGDSDRVFQVITNLLSNAIKFTEEGTIICDIQNKGDFAQAFVKDPGVGINPKDLVRVFDKFQQAGDTLTEKPQGTGLGLPICKEIIEHHKGQIWADSRANKGSTFYFALPYNDSTPVPETVKEVTFQLEDKLEKMEKNEYLILIADEDPQVRNHLQDSLEEEGYRTIQAVNGKEAYDLAREYPVSAILIDIMMYEIDGFDTPHYLKADEKTAGIPIVLLSIVLSKSRKLQLGATSYISHPANADKILNRLSQIYRDQNLELPSTSIYFYGFNRAARKDYELELRNMGISLEHFESQSYMMKAVLQSPPSMIIVDFKETDSNPNDFFLSFRNKNGMEKLPIVSIIHETHIAKRIDSAPIKGLSTTQDILRAINELFGRRNRAQIVKQQNNTEEESYAQDTDR